MAKVSSVMFLLFAASRTMAFQPTCRRQSSTTISSSTTNSLRTLGTSAVKPLFGYGRQQYGSTTHRNNNNERSKRQERVGQLVRNELGQILHRGVLKGSDGDYLDAELRQRISVVSVDVAPDLRQARISVSVRSPAATTTATSATSATSNSEAGMMQAEYNPAVDKRRAYAWLVRNTKSIRHTLAQRMSHMKSSAPDLTFVQVDVAAAVDVMYLIDKVSKGYDKRSDSAHLFNHGDDDDDDFVPTGVVGDINFDEELDDDDWDEDDDFF